jgi:catechol 2,3-dioxygenase-like lactoylglutathione lyase family enzyme
VNIVGLDALVFAVDDLQACSDCLRDYGLSAVELDASGGRFEALDGTAVVIRMGDDPRLPPGTFATPSLRETIYGVAAASDLDAIEDELARDRSVSRDEHGALHSVDDLGFAIGFQVTCRRAFEAPADLTNAPGSAPQRPHNQPGVTADMAALPRTLSHVVYMVPDAVKGEAFYRDRLGFRTTDRLLGAGPFMRPAGADDHHCIFMIQTPPHMQGCEHFTFHLGSGTEVLLAGTRFAQKGWTSFWGPGRHLFGSNWFWYFNSPLGCHIEYDADMDKHDNAWAARQAPATGDNTQLFHFATREKWVPGGPPPARH